MCLCARITESRKEKRNGKCTKKMCTKSLMDATTHIYTTDEEEKKNTKNIYKLFCSAPGRRRVPNFKMAAKMIDDRFLTV